MIIYPSHLKSQISNRDIGLNCYHTPQSLLSTHYVVTGPKPPCPRATPSLLVLLRRRVAHLLWHAGANAGSAVGMAVGGLSSGFEAFPAGDGAAGDGGR